jgi:prepilin-type N-terminal cleavage/methylation domain-containing protein
VNLARKKTSPSPSFSKRRGFTAVEVIVSVAVLAIAVLPVLMSTNAGARSVRLTEYHVIAQTRAKRLLEAFSTYGLGELKDASAGGGTLTPPFSEGELNGAGFELPPEYQRKMKDFHEEYTFEQLGPDLGMVEVKISWKIRGVSHDYKLFRFIGYPTSSTAPHLSLGGS